MINKDFFDGNAYMQNDFQAELFQNVSCEFTKDAVKIALFILLGVYYEKYYTNKANSTREHNAIINKVIRDILKGKIKNWSEVPIKYEEIKGVKHAITNKK